WLELLGGRTLPVYVLHYYPVLVLCALAEPVAPRLAWAAPALPLLLSAVAIVFSLLVHRGTSRVPGLYALPPLARPPATPLGVPGPPRRRAPEAEPGPGRRGGPAAPRYSGRPAFISATSEATTASRSPSLRRATRR